MRNTFTRLGPLLGAAALAVVGFTGTAAAGPAASTSDTVAVTTADAKSSPVRARTDAKAQAFFNGYCEYFELCMFHLNGFQGSGIDFPAFVGFTESTYVDNAFVSPGQGQGQSPANNARSLFNADPFYSVLGCIGENLTGMCAFQPPLTGGDLFPDYFLNLESHAY
ncbi:hypothetical protein [Umezawaea sp.]|uniref:hypothetical protein n=1 Tax=Umezawaea sp. TaxID=1955258 RepID=UPI002ED31281